MADFGRPGFLKKKTWSHKAWGPHRCSRRAGNFRTRRRRTWSPYSSASLDEHDSERYDDPSDDTSHDDSSSNESGTSSCMPSLIRFYLLGRGPDLNRHSVPGTQVGAPATKALNAESALQYTHGGNFSDSIAGRCGIIGILSI